MYATINLPGSSHFRYFGPETRAECKRWLDAWEPVYQGTHGGVWINCFYPARIITNKEAKSMRWQSGLRVITDPCYDWPEENRRTFDPFNPEPANSFQTLHELEAAFKKYCSTYSEWLKREGGGDNWEMMAMRLDDFARWMKDAIPVWYDLEIRGNRHGH